MRDIGEIIYIYDENITNQSRVSLVDLVSNSLVFYGRLQGGELILENE